MDCARPNAPLTAEFSKAGFSTAEFPTAEFPTAEFPTERAGAAHSRPFTMPAGV